MVTATTPSLAIEENVNFVTHVCRRSKLLTSNPTPLLFGAREAGFGDRARRARRAGAMKRPREAGTRPHDLRRDPADDCETPLEAYVHVAFVLSKISQKKNVRKSALRVYDPYFCAGAASERLRALGFASACNEDVDFYAALGDTESRVDDGSTNAPSLPAHDVLVTNPPFSGDHCRRLVAFLATRPRDVPFALLAPEYVHRKAWFAPLARKFEDMLFIVPRTRYAFVARNGGRSANASRTLCRHFARDGECPRGDACPFAHVAHPSRDAAADPKTPETASGDSQNRDASAFERVAPFDVVWHVHCGARGANASVAAAWRQKFQTGKTSGPGSGATLCASVSELERAARASRLPSHLLKKRKRKVE